MKIYFSKFWSISSASFANQKWLIFNTVDAADRRHCPWHAFILVNKNNSAMVNVMNPNSFFLALTKHDDSGFETHFLVRFWIAVSRWQLNFYPGQSSWCFSQADQIILVWILHLCVFNPVVLGSSPQYTIFALLLLFSLMGYFLSLNCKNEKRKQIKDAKFLMKNWPKYSNFRAQSNHAFEAV